jgi:superfamily II DNA/RNA helicase
MAIHPRNNKTSSGENPRAHGRDAASRRPGTGERGPSRWSADDRAKRTDRQGRPAQQSAREQRRAAQFGEPRAEQRDGRDDRRTDWYPGPRTKSYRPGDGDRRPRPERGGTGRSGSDAPGRGDRRERPTYDRPAYDRTQPREQRSERPAHDRQEWRDSPRTDRPARGRYQERDQQRPERPARGRYQERDQRPERPSRDRYQERDQRPERPSRPRYEERGQQRPERPTRDRYQERGQRPDRPARTWSDGDRREQRPERRPVQDRFDARDRQRPERRQHDHADARGARGTQDRRHEPEQRAERWTAPDDVVLEKLDGDVVQADDVVETTFAHLGLGDSITAALTELGAVHPFPIQAVTIPDAVAGKNVLGRGRTGSGKTIAFGAALVERLLRNYLAQGKSGRVPGRSPRALILAPTRELALQIDRTVQPIARSVRLFTTQLVGGVPYPRQVGALRKGVDIVIGTPGRVEDLVDQGILDLSAIEITVLDEADHMAELGFLEPMQRLLRAVPANGQRLLFSATLDSAVTTLVDEFLPGAAVHEVVDEDGVTAVHRVLVVEPGEKVQVLSALLGSTDRSLVFARTRAFAEQLADDLEDAGVRTESLHGDLNQARRTRNLARFSEGKVAALVATDVAARGIHVDHVDLVVHADAAEDYKTYLHRSGRTGRAGASGTVVTLLAPRRRRRFEELLDRAGIEADFVRLQPGADPVAALAR